MQAVAEFIRFHPIQPGSEWIHRAPEIFTTGQRRSHVGETRPPPFREGSAASDTVFPEQGLAFVHSHGCRLAERPGEPLMTLIRKTLLIQRVPPFMSRCQKTRKRLTAHHPSGDAVVGWAEGDGERMGRTGQTGDRGISSPLLQQFLAEPLLSLLRQIPASGGRALLPIQAVDQCRESLPQRCKQLLQPVKAQIGLKRLCQRFPAGARLRQLTRLLLTQIDQSLKRSTEQAEVRALACHLPTGVTIGLRCGQGGHQGRIQRLLPSQILFKQIEIPAMPATAVDIVGTGPFRARIGQQICIGL